MKFKRPSIGQITYFVMGYMLLAFGWWAVHLWRENDLLFSVEENALEYRYKTEQNGVNITQLHATKEYRQMVDRHERRRRMVLGEGIFFTACLMFGLWMIHRSVRDEISLSRQRRNFMLSITHELKSPIAAIRLVLETLLKRQLDRDHQEKLLKNGVRDTDRLNTLVQDLLFAAKLEGEWTPLREDIDIHELVAHIVSGLQLRFPATEFQLDADENIRMVKADASGLTAVLQNLLENAVKYSPEGSPVHISISEKHTKTHIEVADQGIGIPDIEKKRIFEKFYRVGNEDTRKTTGTGLGLYIVYQIVKAHGGTLIVADNKPRGTRFTVEI